MVKGISDYPDTDIAIIGISGCFPGASSADKLWNNIFRGIESITFFDDATLLKYGIPRTILDDPSYVKAAPILDGAYLFDAPFFGYAPREALDMDPQQRILLACAWEALERAGYDAARYDGPIGVFAGAAMNTYLMQPEMQERFRESYLQTLLANDKDFLATRISYKLGLTGPSLSVQTACSSSLVAVHIACQSLLAEECDMALAGGVSVRVPHHSGYVYQSGSVFSPDGHCRPFDRGANGTIFGSGAGVVVLKRLNDAVRDRDTIWAVIKGTAINNDGSMKSDFTAPSIRQQSQAVLEALTMADVEPDTISYVEAHGTGTYIGDPIEISALTSAFRGGTSERQFCQIGSIKSNIGHLDAAAGVAGLIKTAYALKHRKIPPSINFKAPNPEIDFESSPFRVADRLSDWAPLNGVRRAGVQSLGMGGTNAHVILEEAPDIAQVAYPERNRLFVFSAKTAEALSGLTAKIGDEVARDGTLAPADIAHTLRHGRKRFEFRAAIVAKTREDLGQSLDALPAPFAAPGEAPQPGFMFSGQGAQYAGMGRGLYDDDRQFRREVDRAIEAFQPHLDDDLRDVMFPGPDADEAARARINQTTLTQPALFTIEYALAQYWMAAGVTPQWLIGHSIGEYVAACLAGVFDFDAAVEIVAARGRLMQRCPPGAMLAVPLAAADIRPMLDGALSIAAINAADATVVAGAVGAIDSLQARLAELGHHASRLQTSQAFHSPLMTPILDEFRETVARHDRNAPTLPFISNVTGTWITPEQAQDPQYWADHIAKPVLFEAGLATLLADPRNTFIEVGPGLTLTGFVHRHALKRETTVAVPSLRHPKETADDTAFIMTSAGRLWCQGVALDEDAFGDAGRARRVGLPTHPFQETHFSFETAREAAPAEQPRQATAAPVPAIAAVEAGVAGEAAIEAVLERLWTTALGARPISRDANFFETGGHSLAGVGFLQTVRQETGVTLPLATLYEAPTIRALAIKVKDAGGKVADPRAAPAAGDVTAAVAQRPEARGIASGATVPLRQARPSAAKPMRAAIRDNMLSGLKNRFLQVLALYAPGMSSVRVRLHRWRGVEIGENVAIGTAVHLETSYPSLISIGNNVQISQHTIVIGHFRDTTNYALESGEPTVVIEDEAFIGPGVILMPNIRIGRGAVISAGSVVFQSVPEFSVVQGNPAKVVARSETALAWTDYDTFTKGLTAAE